MQDAVKLAGKTPATLESDALPVWRDVADSLGVFIGGRRKLDT